MASLTIRGIEESLKKRLKLRAAGNNRSMEEEIRHILAEAGQHPVSSKARTQSLQSNLPQPAARGAPPTTARGSLVGRRVVLVITGGIAAYKALDLIRRLKERGATVRVVLTRAAQQFVTALAAGALSGERVHTDLFDADSEFDVGHIRIARDTDAIVVAPCTADFLARIALGLADDLASAVMLATDKPVLIAPAMNPFMWRNAATQRNLARARDDGIAVVGPNAGEMAEAGEAGLGRMAEPSEIADALEALFGQQAAPLLSGLRVLVTSGPTHEAIDPIRYIANRSSGKQGFAIARAAAAAGADVTLVTGPVNLPAPHGVNVTAVESARDMLAAVEKALPVDVAIFAAAVADWRTDHAEAQKLKKRAGATPQLALVENPDILSTIAHRSRERPRLVIGFAAETENVVDNARAKLARKGCDWILANDVSLESGIAGGVMGGDRNAITLVTAKGAEPWPEQSKDEVAHLLIQRIAAEMSRA
jgi:phosphopantothenoylcysteine decarboxylase/phosphopantothenate--cysteine ligase